MDGIRAAACLTVFLANFHHSLGMTVSGRSGVLDLARFAESGIGVALFLVLSGTLLSLPFWRSLGPNRRPVDWRSFALRRAVRVIPPYYACLLAFFVLKGVDDAFDAASYFLFINNLRESSFYGVSPQFWTIGLFVQLYFLLPVLFAVVRRITERRTAALALITILSAAAYVLHYALMATRHQWVAGPLTRILTADGWVLSHSTLAHLPHFLLGVAGGEVLLRLSGSRRNARGMALICEAAFWTSAAGLAVIAAVPAADALQLPYARYWFPWMPALAAVTIVTAPFAPFARFLLELAPVRWIGVISYGVYIYHVAVMQLVRRLLGEMNFDDPTIKLQFAALSLAVTLIVATGSYLLLERPLLRWGARKAAHQPAQSA
jgi:peptidoglycan/LPS O-acetylase OafA/YrhL